MNQSNDDETRDCEESFSVKDGGDCVLDNSAESEGWCMSPIKIVLIALIVVVIILVILDSAVDGAGYTGSLAKDFFGWLGDHPGEGICAFILLYAFATAFLFIPASILTIGAGYAFGMAVGDGLGLVLASLSVFLGASIGSVWAFLLGRYIFKDASKKLSERYSKFRAIDKAMQRKGLRIMILLRISPLVPFNVLGYICGTTSISFKNYTLALLGLLPGVVLFCFIGVAGCTFTNDSSNPVTICSVIIGILFAVAGIMLISRYAKKELDQITEESSVTSQRSTAVTAIRHDSNTSSFSDEMRTSKVDSETSVEDKIENTSTLVNKIPTTSDVTKRGLPTNMLRLSSSPKEAFCGWNLNLPDQHHFD